MHGHADVQVANQVHDADLMHFVEDFLLHEQAQDVKHAATLVSQVRRAGHGHGVFHIDALLLCRYGGGEGGAADGNGADGINILAGPLAG